jgi:hypothetical protein
MRGKPHKFSRESGLSLVEVMITLGILGIVGALGSQFLPKVDSSRYRIEAMGSRDAISMRVRRVITKQNIIFSAQAFPDPGNRILLNCVDMNPATICNATNSAAMQTFRLGYPFQNGATAVAGPDQTPLRYDHNGGECPPVGRCNAEFDARAFFYAQCPNETASCGDALSVRVRYQIRNTSLKGQPLLASSPPDIEFKDANRGIISIVIQDKTLKGVCPPFSVLRSIDQTGQLNCVCQPGSTQTGTNMGQVICAPTTITCPNNQTHRLIGYTPTMEPICVPRPRFTCTEVTNEQACMGIIQSVRLGECRVEQDYQAKKGSSNSYVTCDGNKQLCCTE